MKKILIILGIVLILILTAVWVYLMVYGKPKSIDDIFARFNTTNDAPVFIETPDSTPIIPETESKPKALRQLSFRAVAGAGFYENAMRFVEQGTGHIYEVDFNGAERVVSGTTIPQATRAVFSPNGEYVAITKSSGLETETIVGTIDSSGALTGNSLPKNAKDIAFTDTRTLSYTLSGVRSTSGYTLDLTHATKTSDAYFTIPLRDIRMHWGTTTYIATTPTATQLGYVYKLTKGSLSYVTAGGWGLMPIPYRNGIAITEYISDNNTRTLVTETIDTPSFAFVSPTFSEKCVPVPKTRDELYCAIPGSLPNGTYPDDWYKGVVSLSDNLWHVAIGEQTSRVLSNFLDESGREIDVIAIGTNEDGRYIYLINKNDDSLWLFDTRVGQGI